MSLTFNLQRLKYLLLAGIFGACLVIVRILWTDRGISLPAQVQDFITLSLSVLIEATPFVVLGILFSLIVRHLIPEKLFYASMPRRGMLRRLYLSVLGLFLPVCECGNVPLARGLLMKGLTPSEVITFILGAPLLNPITIATTIIAFGGDMRIVAARIMGGIVISNTVGWLFSTFKKEKGILTSEFKAMCEHVHDADSKRLTFIKSFKDEANNMMIPLVVGSMVAGATQILIPRSLLTTVGGHVVLSIAAMIILAFVVSICASVDAFFALAYVNQFTPGSLVSFLVFGPMIDIKLISLLKTTFQKKALALMAGSVFLMSFLLGLAVNYAF